MSFYITLPSDSSMRYFSENTISHFTTRLPNPIELKGDWEVALAEFIYPHTWYNVNSSNNHLGFIYNNNIEIPRTIPVGCYETVNDILKAIYTPSNDGKIVMKYHPVTKLVRIKLRQDAKVVLKTGLSEMLGFKPKTVQMKENEIESIEDGSFVADPSAHYKVMMLYTDIVEPQIVGDVLAPLLRVVTVTGLDGETIREQFDRPHYLPVSRKMIETLEIVIRTHTGDLIPFERGRSIVKLHFRQKYLS